MGWGYVGDRLGDRDETNMYILIYNLILVPNWKGRKFSIPINVKIFLLKWRRI